MGKTLPSNAEGAGSIPGRRAKIPHASWPRSQTYRRNNMVTSSIKTLKMVHIKKNFFNKKRNNFMGITHSSTPDSLYLVPFVQTQTTHPLERWKLFTQLQPHLRAEIFPNFNL